MGRVTRRYPVLRFGPEGPVRRADVVAVEEPLEIRLDGRPWQVTMRTPGHDLDLAHGLLHAEGVVGAVADVVAARYCAGADADGVNSYNVVDVSLAATASPPDPALARQVLTTSACGICGTTSVADVLRTRRYPVPSGPIWPVADLLAAPDRLREQQRTFARTGGLHAAGLLGVDGTVSEVREDVGRHNAVDKVLGAALRAGRLPLADAGLVVSGRASFELTQKALLAGIGTLVAVSAPSSLAVELAAEAGLTLIGFVRGDRLNVYTHPERVRLAD